MEKKKFSLVLITSAILLILFNVFIAEYFEWSYLVSILFIILVPIVVFYYGYKKGMIKKEKLILFIVFSILTLFISGFFLYKNI